MASKKFFKKTSLFWQVLLIIVAPLFLLYSANAAILAPRAVVLSSSLPSASATHTHAFTVPSASVVGSVVFEYCTNSPLENNPCTPPAGLNLLGSTLSSQLGNPGFVIDALNSSSNRMVITRVPAPMSTVATVYSFDNVVNPSTPQQTTFVRISTHSSIDGSGPSIDHGSVAFAIVPQFTVNAFVPPYLTFCVGESVAINCSSATGDRINFGELQKNLPSVAVTQFSGATNDPTGYATYINGSTMTSGANIINPLSSNSPSVAGTSQFGLNLRANTNPSVGIDPEGIGTSSITPNYAVPNSFRFVDGEALTSSPLSTDFRRFTVSYIVNVTPAHPPGVYTTTLTYTAIASF